MAEKPYTALRELQWRLEALAWSVFSTLVRAAPIDAVSDFGGGLFRRLGPLTGVHKTVLRNLRVAFPDWTDDERERTARDHWESVGRTILEFSMIDRIMADKSRIECVNRERLEEIAASGRPVIFVSGHFANWEVMPATCWELGIEYTLAYRAANNPYVEAQIRASRSRYVEHFAPRSAEGGRRLIEGLGRGVSVAVLNDQKYDEGIEAPFFGRPVRTLPLAVRFALRFGADLQPVSVQRLKGARFRLVVHDPIEPARTGSRADDIAAGVRRINQFIEECVRERPSEWWWVHRRFPKEVYAELQAQGY
ncbi:MAG: lysophospholipid acyltransferase family protein [Caulobacterales bacterium]